MKHFATKYVCAHILDISSGFSLETSVSQHSNTQETNKRFSGEKTRPKECISERLLVVWPKIETSGGI